LWPGAVWMVSGKGVLDGVVNGNRQRGRGSFGDFVAYLCESDALFPNYFGDDLLCSEL